MKTSWPNLMMYKLNAEMKELLTYLLCNRTTQQTNKVIFV